VVSFDEVAETPFTGQQQQEQQQQQQQQQQPRSPISLTPADLSVDGVGGGGAAAAEDAMGTLGQ